MEVIDLDGNSKLYNLEELSQDQFSQVIKSNLDNLFNFRSTDPLRKQVELFPIKKNL